MKAKVLGFSAGQRAKFFPVRDHAWLAECERVGADPADKVLKETWYRAQLDQLQYYDEAGQPSTKLCDQVEDFDAVMGHFALLANDAYWIDRTARGAEIRMQYLIRNCTAEIAALTGQDLTSAYAEGIAEHMHLAPDPDDIPAEHLRRVFQSLDTHLRRLRRRHDQEAPAGLPV